MLQTVRLNHLNRYQLNSTIVQVHSSQEVIGRVEALARRLLQRLVLLQRRQRIMFTANLW